MKVAPVRARSAADVPRVRAALKAIAAMPDVSGVDQVLRVLA